MKDPLFYICSPYLLPGPTTAAALAPKFSGSLHGPLPLPLYVWIHHLHAPGASTVAGVTEHTPVPGAHPACAAVYHANIFGAVIESFTQSRYHVAVGTAFQL